MCSRIRVCSKVSSSALKGDVCLSKNSRLLISTVRTGGTVRFRLHFIVGYFWLRSLCYCVVRVAVFRWRIQTSFSIQCSASVTALPTFNLIVFNFHHRVFFCIFDFYSIYDSHIKRYARTYVYKVLMWLRYLLIVD